VDAAAREEFRDFVAGSSGALLRTAYLLTGNRSDAEDLLQTALAKTYLAWPRIRERHAVDAYVRRTMVNTRTSWWRRDRHVKPAGHDEHLAALPTAGRDPIADADLHEALWTALARLPRRQRAAVVLRYYEELSEAETAAALGVSVGTIKSTVARGLAKLREDAGLRDDERAALPADLQGATP
jgi:RNA polymerase sigma-70 factor (sigma-E family)